VPETAPNPNPAPHRRPTLVSAGLLLVALALVVIYTSHRAFLSPLALVVVAAIGFAALLLQLRLRPDISSIRGPLWLNGTGVVLALGAVCADFLHLNPAVMVIAALAAVVFFALSGIIVLAALRKRRV
jgi:FtsH-binding integral membrane protein